MRTFCIAGSTHCAKNNCPYAYPELAVDLRQGSYIGGALISVPLSFLVDLLEILDRLRKCIVAGAGFETDSGRHRTRQRQASVVGFRSDL